MRVTPLKPAGEQVAALGIFRDRKVRELMQLGLGARDTIYDGVIVGSPGVADQGRNGAQVMSVQTQIAFVSLQSSGCTGGATVLACHTWLPLLSS